MNVSDSPDEASVIAVDSHDGSSVNAAGGAELQSDTVNRIRLYDETGREKEEPLCLVSLIEHKSDVDYDVVM